MPPAPRPAARRDALGRREPGSAAVLVEAVARGVPRRTRSAASPGVRPPPPARRASRTCSSGGASADPRRSGPGPGARPGLTDTQHWTGPGSDCSRFMWYVIDSGRLGRRQSAWSTFHEPRAARSAGQQPLVGVEDDPVRRVLEAGERAAFSRGSASRSSARASSAWVAMTTASNVSCVPPAVRTTTPAPLARDIDDRVAGPDRVRADPVQDPLDVGHRAARDRPPLERPADADEPVVVEEAQQVVERVVAGSRSDGGRPHGGRDRHEEVVAERMPEPHLVEVVAERHRRWRSAVVEPTPGRPGRSAGCPGSSRQWPGRIAARRLGEPAPGAARAELDVACPARRAEAHVARLRLDAELADHPQERRVGDVVVDDEAHVDARPAHRRCRPGRS